MKKNKSIKIKSPLLKKDKFKKPTNKNRILTNNHDNRETFIEATRNKSQDKIKKTQASKYSNLTVKERKAVQQLQSRHDIVITDANEGGAVVVQDVEYYVKEAERQLNNKENYRKINNDPTTTNNETTFNQLLKRCHHTSKIQLTFLERLTNLAFFQTIHILFL